MRAFRGERMTTILPATSGIQWLGGIPRNWKIVRSKNLFGQRKERARASDQQLTASQDYGVIPQTQFMEKAGRQVVQVVLNPEILNHVEEGDFVISMRSFQGGLEMAKATGCISSAYVVLKPTESIHRGFFSYLFKSTSYVQALQATSNLVRDGQALRYENFCLVDLPLVPLAEQARIAEYLDRKTAAIDALIEKKQKLVELLAEKRAALINQAVTKGLDPTVPMKDSGIPWIGEIPAHWELSRLSLLTTLMQTGPFGSQLHADSYIDGGYPVVNPTNLTTTGVVGDSGKTVDYDLAMKLARHRFRVGDVVFARRGELGRCSIVTENESGWICGTGCILVRPNLTKATPEFISFASRAKWFQQWLSLQSVGSTMDNLNTSILGRVPMPCPPIAEQNKMLRQLAARVSSYDCQLTTVSDSLALLQEYRQALITAAVTGQLEIPEEPQE